MKTTKTEKVIYWTSMLVFSLFVVGGVCLNIGAAVI